MSVFNDTSQLLTYFIFSLIIVFYIKFFYINRKIFQFASHNKGFFLPFFPVIGNLYVALFAEKQNLLSIANWLQENVGSPLNFWIGHTYHFVTTDAKDIKIILNHPMCINKSRIYNDVEYFFGKSSLAFANKEEWKDRRKHFIKSFKPNILKGFVDIFYRYSFNLIEDIKKFDGAVVPYECMHRHTFNTFCVTALGLDDKKFEKEIAEFGGLREKIEEGITQKVISPYIPYWLWINYFPSGRRTAKYLAQSRVILEKVIRTKKMELEGHQDYIENSNEVPLLDLILSYDHKIMSDEQIFQELVLFTSASTESSSYVFYLGFTLLGMHPDIQEKLYNEIVKEIGENAITSKNIANLKYTEAVVCEILRLAPSVPFIARLTGDDIDLGNKVIPKGVDVVVDLYHLHREPGYWKDPEKFDPTRFLPENIDKVVPYSYIPFSIGPRDCIGKNHGMTLLKITFANVVRSFKILSNHKSMDEFKLCSAITIYPSQLLDLRFVSR